MKERLCDEEEATSHWRQEIKILKKIEKKAKQMTTARVICVLDDTSRKNSKSKYLVMEWIEGQNLSEFQFHEFFSKQKKSNHKNFKQEKKISHKNLRQEKKIKPTQEEEYVKFDELSELVRMSLLLLWELKQLHSIGILHR